MAKFADGEVVLFVPDFTGDPPLNKYAGEVEIICFDGWFDEYVVKAPDGVEFFACESVLRKRPNPPDWNKLAQPTDIEVPEHV